MSDLNPRRLEDYEAAVGRICRLTAQIDRQVLRLIQHLTDTNEATAACMMSKTNDTASRCEVAARLLILRTPDGEWRKKALAILEFARNDIGKRRNRYVHDEWGFSEDKAFRTDRTVKSMKAKSHQPMTIVRETTYLTEYKDLQELIEVCLAAVSAIGFIRRELVVHQATGQPPISSGLIPDLSTYKFQDSFGSGGSAR